MANTLDVQRFYDTMAKILGKKLGVRIEGEVVKRQPGDGKGLFKFD